MRKKINRNKLYRKWRRKMRIKRKIFATAERPRLCVFKSLRHIYAQIINDQIHHTVVSASSLEGELKDKSRKEKAQGVGRLIAQRALEKGIKKVVFDRNGFSYTGRLKLLAEEARKAGLCF